MRKLGLDDEAIVELMAVVDLLLFAHMQDLVGNQIELYEERFPEDADSLGSIP